MRRISSPHAPLPVARPRSHVVLRMSSLFLRTLREDPADAEVPSHRLLVRAGYVRRVAPGIYSWLPLGLARAAQRRARSCARRWTRIGAPGGALPRAAAARAVRGDRPLDRVRRQALPAQGPQGRRLPARPDARGDVHARWSRASTPRTRTCRSTLYQIQTKYRDEARPRAGILRGREFVMKDSYSFDVDDAGLQASYDRAPRRLHPDLRPARPRVRDRLRDVRRDGRLARPRSSSPPRRPARTPSCAARTCGYAANVEAVTTAVAAPAATPAAPAAHVEDTPDTPTIETLVALATR